MQPLVALLAATKRPISAMSRVYHDFMEPIYHMSQRLWMVLKAMPRVPRRVNVPTIVFTGGWLVLTAFGVTESTAFIVTLGLALQAYLIVVLPGAVTKNRSQDQSLTLLTVCFALLTAANAAQILAADPDLSHRILSCVCLGYIVIFLGLVEMRTHSLHQRVSNTESLDKVRELARHWEYTRVMCAVIIIAVNEASASIGLPYGERVLILGVLPITLFGLFHLSIFFTAPRIEFDD